MLLKAADDKSAVVAELERLAAGLWNTWTDSATGEILECYSMLTVNADHHPLMSRMHKPDPKLPPDEQDKRSVIPIEPADVDAWRIDRRGRQLGARAASRGVRRRPANVSRRPHRALSRDH